MIVIPPQDPNERPIDPAAEALGKLYEQFTNVQNLGEFHAALRKRDALYDIQHQEMSDKPQDYENLHPRDFYRQFDRRADEDDKTVLAEAPYPIRQQLRDVLAPEHDTARKRALETYKKLFIDRQLAQLDEDRLYYFGKLADAANDQDRERYVTALVGRLKLSGDVGLLYKDDADRLIENIPSDLDIFTYNREFAADPARAQRLLLYGAYPNIRPEVRDELVKAAKESTGPSTANQLEEQVNSEIPGYAAQSGEAAAPTANEQALQTQQNAADSESNNGASPQSNETKQDGGYATDADPEYRPGVSWPRRQAAPRPSRARSREHPSKQPKRPHAARRGRTPKMKQSRLFLIRSLRTTSVLSLSQSRAMMVAFTGRKSWTTPPR